MVELWLERDLACCPRGEYNQSQRSHYQPQASSHARLNIIKELSAFLSKLYLKHSQSSAYTQKHKIVSSFGPFKLYTTPCNVKTQPKITMTNPTSCCGKSGQGCVWYVTFFPFPRRERTNPQASASQAKCSCGEKSALHCSCDKATTENAVTGARCSCRARPAGACTCDRAKTENSTPSGDLCSCGSRPSGELPSSIYVVILGL